MRVRNALTICLSIAALGAGRPALAFDGTVSESQAWQFMSQADKVNQAAVQDLIRKKKGGYYQAPVYTTNIDRQYNCNVAANAYGNSGSNSTVALSPSQGGATATSTGNANSSNVNGYGGTSTGGGVSSDQANSGTVRSGVSGGTRNHVSGDSWQALNSTQTNSGSQSASVGGSSACTFGALN